MEIITLIATSSLISAVVSGVISFFSSLYASKRNERYKKNEEKRKELKEALKELLHYKDNIEKYYYKIENIEDRTSELKKDTVIKFDYYLDKYNYCKIYFDNESTKYFENLINEIKDSDFFQTCEKDATKKLHSVFNASQNVDIFEEELVKTIQELIKSTE